MRSDQYFRLFSHYGFVYFDALYSMCVFVCLQANLPTIFLIVQLLMLLKVRARVDK